MLAGRGATGGDGGRLSACFRWVETCGTTVRAEAVRVPGILRADAAIEGIPGLTVGDFWAWAYSDVLSNANRSTLAEFLVGSALAVVRQPRVEWDGVDLRYRDHGIEAKASGLVQSWPQTAPWRPRFDIGKKRAWDARTNRSNLVPTRAAGCYVFCLHAEGEREKANPLDVAQWEFYVVGRPELERRYGDRQSVLLGALRQHCEPTGYAGLRSSVDAVLQQEEDHSRA